MKKFDAIKYFLLLSALSLTLSACVSEPAKVESNLYIKGAPDWVNRGSSAVSGNDGRMFYGIGSASPMGDMALQKATADDRARAEIARILSSYMQLVSNDYLASVRSGKNSDKNSVLNEEAVSRQINNTSRLNMAGARIIGSWRDPQSSTIWSIAELDMKHVKSTIAGVNEMNTDLKQYIETSAENIFDRIAKEKK